MKKQKKKNTLHKIDKVGTMCANAGKNISIFISSVANVRVKPGNMDDKALNTYSYDIFEFPSSGFNIHKLSDSISRF